MAVTSSTVGAKMVSVEAVVIRADGRREDLGMIAFYHANPLKRWAWKLGQLRKSFMKRFSRKGPQQ